MAGYLLLLANLVLVALLLTALGYLCVAIVRRVFGSRQERPASRTAAPEQVWRRCTNCKHRWHGTPGEELSPTSLRLRRTVRRVARKRKREVDWAKPRGWSRCPSCLSSEVRDSRRQTR